MATPIRIKRRLVGESSGAPNSLLNAELAFNETDQILYYGLGTIGVNNQAANIISIGGSGAFVSLSGDQTIAGTKTFSNAIVGSFSNSLSIGAGLSESGTSYNGGAARTISLPLTGVTAQSYGSATSIPVITVDAYGRITAASTSSISTTINLSGNSGTGFVNGGGTLTFTGGTGITTNVAGSGVTIAIDSTVVTLTGSQTLTNKTLTSPVISTISNTGTLTLPTSTDTLVGRATTDTFTNKTFNTASTGNVFRINSNQITDVTGSGLTAVLQNSPTLITPTLGVATATSINKVTITAPATSATLTISDGKTLTTNNSLTFSGTDGKTLTFNNTLTFNGNDSSSINFGAGGTVAYTGSTLAQFSPTTSSQLAGVITDETGSGSLVFATSPSLTTPSLGVATATSVTATTSSLTLAGTGANGNVILQPAGTGVIDVSGFRVTNAAAPINGNDLTNKTYVDNLITGLNWKTAANLLADTNVALTGTSGTLVIDGHDVLVDADDGYRILLIAQNTSSDNGIYVYADNGTTYTLSRSSDTDTYQELIGTSILILEGTKYANTGWVQTNHYLTSFSGQIWSQFSGAGFYSAGTGLSLSGTTFNVLGTTNRITVGADNVDIAATYVGQTSITTLGTLTTGTWNATTISPTYGGTGLTSYAVGDLLYASGSATLAKLAGVATGNVLISGGVATAPSWGKVGLTTHVSGTLGVTNGGTGLASTPTNGQLLIGNGSGYTLNTLAVGAGITVTNGSGTITIASTGVTSLAVSGNGISINGSTGALTISTGATSANTVSTIVFRDASGNFSAGTISATTLSLTNDLDVPNGGTGVGTFTSKGILYGNGTGAIQVTAAAGGADTSTSNQILTVDGSGVPVWASVIDGGTF